MMRRVSFATASSFVAGGGNAKRKSITTAATRCTSLWHRLVLLQAVTTTLRTVSAMASSSSSYDLVVVGGGSAGLTAAKFAATFGKSVVIVEKARLGGDCTWTGCVPSKALLKSAGVAHDARTAGRYGIAVDGVVAADAEAVRDRLSRIRKRIYDEDDSPEALRALGVDTIEGDATLSEDGRRVRVSTSSGVATEVTAREGVVLATGAAPRAPENIEGLATVNHVTYERIFDLDRFPARLTVVGGGPIGCELAQAFARLGSEVTLVAERLLPDEDELVGETMAEVFAREGVALVRGRATSARPDPNDASRHYAVATTTNGETVEVEGDLLLLSVGRVPVVDGLGLEAAGVELDPNTGGVRVDRTLRTTNRRVYAAGDCTGDRQFTHYAGYQGAIAARNVLLPLADPGRHDEGGVPATIFTDPEVASIGLTEKRAIEKHGADRVAVSFKRITDVDRAACCDEADGFLKVVYHAKNYRILGATIVSTSAGEIVSEISVAMKAKMGFDQLATVMHAYPTYSIALQTMAAEVYYEKLAKSKGLYNFLKKLGL